MGSSYFALLKTVSRKEAGHLRSVSFVFLLSMMHCMQSCNSYGKISTFCNTIFWISKQNKYYFYKYIFKKIVFLLRRVAHGVLDKLRGRTVLPGPVRIGSSSPQFSDKPWPRCGVVYPGSWYMGGMSWGFSGSMSTSNAYWVWDHSGLHKDLP